MKTAYSLIETVIVVFVILFILFFIEQAITNNEYNLYKQYIKSLNNNLYIKKKMDKSEDMQVQQSQHRSLL